jgi:hypothetical protein
MPGAVNSRSRLGKINDWPLAGINENMVFGSIYGGALLETLTSRWEPQRRRHAKGAALVHGFLH